LVYSNCKDSQAHVLTKKKIDNSLNCFLLTLKKEGKRNCNFPVDKEYLSIGICYTIM